MQNYLYRFWPSFLTGMAAIFLLSDCHGGSGRSADSDSLKALDSLEQIAVRTRQEIRLPDTVFESAKAIDYKIINVDTAVTGVLNSTKDLYADTPGAFTFRKDSRRDADFGGSLKSRPSGFNIDWTFKTAENYKETALGKWGGGSGWTGQPVYVEWPDSLLARMKADNVVYNDFSGKEIIFGSLCGNVYFVDFETGKPSRKEISGDNPIKGSVSLDPTLNGNLYVGQGVPAVRPFGAFGVNLFTNVTFFYLPEDSQAWRRWGAFDSSQVRVGQFLFTPGENGSVYKFTVSPGNAQRHTVLRYKVAGAAPGIESSMAVYGNYGFICDNHGNIICINLDNMQPVWLYKLGDDTDSTPVIIEEDGIPMLYVGCEIDRQGIDGKARFVKLNALQGAEVWKIEIPGKKRILGQKSFDGGFYASSLPGNGNCSDKIYVSCVRNTKGENDALLAIDRKSGKILFETPLKHYGWSSPVRFLDENGRMFIVVGDCAGRIYIIDGENGDVIYDEKVGNNFESSPVVIDNSLVVGSRGNSIFKITLK